MDNGDNSNEEALSLESKEMSKADFAFLRLLINS